MKINRHLQLQDSASIIRSRMKHTAHQQRLYRLYAVICSLIATIMTRFDSRKFYPAERDVLGLGFAIVNTNPFGVDHLENHVLRL